MKFYVFFSLLFSLSCDAHHETREKAVLAQPKTPAPFMEQKNTFKTGPQLYEIPKDHPLPKKQHFKPEEFGPFSARNLDFSMAFFKRLSQASKSNFIFSPIGLAKNMAMMHAGAAGETKKEIEKVMHFNLSNEDAFYTYFGERKFKWIKQKPVMDKMNIFVPEDIQLKLRARTIISDVLHGSIHYTPTMDAQKTRESINSLSGLGEHPPLLGPRALDKDWQLIFSSSLLYQGSYSNYKGFANDKGFMKRQVPRIGYANVDGVHAIELKSDAKALLILMPKDFKTFEEKKLNADFMTKIRKALKLQDVNLKMNGFKVHTQSNILPLLRAIGINNAFSAEADFSEFSYEKLKVDAFIDQADLFFSIDLKPEMFKGKFDLNIDKPFFFLLRDEEEGSLFFMGGIKDLKAAAITDLPTRR